MPVRFKNTTNLSQLQQAFAIEYVVEHWCSNMPYTTKAVYGQINDYWCAPLCASMDYKRRREVLHYSAIFVWSTKLEIEKQKISFSTSKNDNNVFEFTIKTNKSVMWLSLTAQPTRYFPITTFTLEGSG